MRGQRRAAPTGDVAPGRERMPVAADVLGLSGNTRGAATVLSRASLRYGVRAEDDANVDIRLDALLAQHVRISELEVALQ